MAKWLIEKAGPRAWNLYEKAGDFCVWQGLASTHSGAVGLMVESEKEDAQLVAAAIEAFGDLRAYEDAQGIPHE
jgi:hypothetical protein